MGKVAIIWRESVYKTGKCKCGADLLNTNTGDPIVRNLTFAEMKYDRRAGYAEVKFDKLYCASCKSYVAFLGRYDGKGKGLIGKWKGDEEEQDDDMAQN